MADKKVKGAGNRFLPGSNIAKHREWRGLKDTWYDYVEWVKVLGIMGGFVAKSPVRIARGMLTYRWMGSYLGAGRARADHVPGDPRRFQEPAPRAA